MTIYGILTEKSSIQNQKFNNRYWCQESSLSAAVSLGETIVAAEQIVFSDLVDFTNIHVWQPYTSPNVFTNQPLSLLGDIDADNPMASWICFELLWGVEGSYTHYKRYRVQTNTSSLLGLGWSSAFLTQAALMVDALNELVGVLTTRNGVVLGECQLNPRYVMNQEGKRWYNRTIEE